MVYLTKQQIISINKHQIDTFGGTYFSPDNFFNERSLHYLIEVIESTLFGEEVYQEIYHKTGLYFYQIVVGHIFQDGNKRTGNQTSLIFLALNGFQLKKEVSQNELIEFTFQVAEGELSLDLVQGWFKNNIEKIV